MNRRVVVTGLGAITPIGNTVGEFWQGLITGKSGVDKITSFDASQFPAQIAAEVKGLDPLKYLSPKDTKRMDKFVQYAVCASLQALSDSGLEIPKEDTWRIGVLIGSGIGSLRVTEEQHKIYLSRGPNKLSPFMIPMLIVNMASGQVSITLRLRGPNSTVATACASGTHALGDAFKIIQRGDADVMFAGGTESCITPMGVGGFCALKGLSTRNDDPKHASRPFCLDRDGFVMGEGAGVAILESLEHAKARGAKKLYAEVVGYGMSADAYHMTAPDPDGAGAARCMENAIHDAGMKPEDINYINAHGTSTKLNDKIETLAIKRVFKERAKRIPVSSTKSMTGHLLGAAGGVEFVASCMTIKENLIHPTTNYDKPDPDCDLDYVPNQARRQKVDTVLSKSFGFGGHNACLVVRRFLA